MSKADWEVKRATVSRQNGGLYLEGVNHCTGETFGWHVLESLDSPRYDFSGAEFGPGAQTILARHRKAA